MDKNGMRMDRNWEGGGQEMGKDGKKMGTGRIKN